MNKQLKFGMMLPERPCNSMVSTDLWKPIRTRWPDGNASLVLSPDSEFFRYFGSSVPRGENKTDAFASQF